MPYSVEGKLVVAISSRALFDFEEENRVFERDGETAYIALQFARLDVPAREGVAFPLVKKLLAFNTAEAQRVEVVILSKNDPVSGLRVFRSAAKAGLKLERGVFTRGRSPYRYLDSLNANLFLSANENDVMSALEAKCPAARVYPESAQAASRHANEVRIAFDGDAVLFSDEAEAVYQRDGLEAFTRHEIARALQPLPPGPFKPLLEALHRLQSERDLPITLRTALVTARSAPAHERAVRTLMEWNVAVDEAMFLGGLDKGAFLKAFEPDFYFDDQHRHVDSARLHVAAGHVPFGVANIR
ncbi:MAG: 5'-nucleotidase [Betaproteobacteria bacterium RIFCSPLOWO2_12_FULL_65_14]|nr:MAG: 5'-nucleotidase [Betaproteobacteria bacterium RIFCSPLOWO2_12_FULL_65_14]